MNLWLRLLAVLIGAMRRPACKMLEESVIRVRIWPNDLDVHGHVNNGRYLTLADLARVDFVVRSGLARMAMKLRAIPVVGDVSAKYRRELRLFDKVEIRTRLVGWDAKWSFLEHRFVRAGKTVAIVTARGVLRTAGGTLAPAQLVQAAGLDAQSPTLPAAIRMWNESCDAAYSWQEE